ncbi:MAG: Re/Si-specific NAD(P)(+) transhydrogenase subunit alpha [Acidimicrobiaceae bacterium]|nr:Re/Si-specific NAD(P)(+) transhydrogenase subunit alpha [Acidimicrobiaceae bacterium]
MKVVVPKETANGERRVAVVPDLVPRLKAAGLEVWIQSGAGLESHHDDLAYQEAGATVTGDIAELFREAKAVLKVQPPTLNEVKLMPPNAVLVSFLYPGRNPEILSQLSQGSITALALELLPRISRAQSMDALSSQASLAGYKAMIMGAARLDKIIPMQMTAAGTLAPARVFVMGAGVAGLQAIATARRLGAIIEAFDVRSAVKDEIESLGAKFIEIPLESSEGSGGYAAEQSEDYLRRQRELLSERVAAADILITTAAVPGRKAPILVTKDMVSKMRSGSVIIDLASESGGNCEVTVPGVESVFEGVTVVGLFDIPSSVSVHASQTYSRNVSTLLLALTKDGKFQINFDDELVNASCVAHSGELRLGYGGAAKETNSNEGNQQ